MQFADADHDEVQSYTLYKNQRRLDNHSIILNLLNEEDLALDENACEDHGNSYGRLEIFDESLAWFVVSLRPVQSLNIVLIHLRSLVLHRLLFLLVGFLARCLLVDRVLLSQFALGAQQIETLVFLFLGLLMDPASTGILGLDLVVSVRMAETRKALDLEVTRRFRNRLIWVAILAQVQLLRATRFLVIKRFVLARVALRLHLWQIWLWVVHLFFELIFLASGRLIQKLGVVALLGITSLIIRHVRNILVIQLNIVYFWFSQRVVGFSQYIWQLFWFFFVAEVLSFTQRILVLGAFDLVRISRDYKRLIPLSDLNLVVQKLIAHYNGIFIVNLGTFWLLGVICLVDHTIRGHLRLIEHADALFLRDQAGHAFWIPSHGHIINIFIIFWVHVDPISDINRRTWFFFQAFSGLAPIILFCLGLNFSAGHIGYLHCLREIFNIKIDVCSFFGLNQRVFELQLQLFDGRFLDAGSIRVLKVPLRLL